MKVNPDKFEHYVVQGCYFGEWEDLTANDDPKEIRNEWETYNKNEPEIPHRVQAVWKSGKRRTVSD